MISLKIKTPKPKAICRKRFVATCSIIGKKEITGTPVCTRIVKWMGVYVECSTLCWHEQRGLIDLDAGILTFASYFLPEKWKNGFGYYDNNF